MRCNLFIQSFSKMVSLLANGDGSALGTESQFRGPRRRQSDFEDPNALEKLCVLLFAVQGRKGRRADAPFSTH